VSSARRPLPARGGVRTNRLSPSGFGLGVAGIDLSRRDEALESWLLEAFHHSGGLLSISGQDGLSPERLCEFVSRFGRLEKNEKYNPGFLLPDYPEILRIGNLKEGDAYRSLFVRADADPLLWHSDDSFRDPQPMGSCLYCVATPPEGGDTYFAGGIDAYRDYEADDRDRLATLVAVHSYDYLNEFLRLSNPHRPPLSAALKAKHPPVRRPLVARHPVSGERGFYLPRCHIESIEGMSRESSDELLDRLLDHTTSPAFRYRHRWRVGDLVFWDNRSALHAPSPFDDARYPRLMYRLTMEGEQIANSP